MKGPMLVAAGALAFASSVSFAAAEMSYEGKDVTLLINFAAGGSSDIEGRLVAQHLAKHIPGNPNIIVQNMPGGGGNTGSNYLGQAAAADGTTIGFFTWNPIDQLIEAPGLMIQYDDFQFIAGISQPTLFYMRKDVAPGIETPEDLLNAERFRAGSLSPTIHQTVRTRLALDLLDVEYDLVSGYTGLTEIATAVLQNEIQLSNGSLASYKPTVVPMLIDPGIAIPMFHFDVESDGEFHADPLLEEFGGVTFLDLYRAKHGEDAMPSGDNWEALRLINNIMEAMFRSVFMPPNAPEEAVETMRAAFQALSEDEEFIADFERTVGIPPMMTIGDQGQEIIRALGDVDPEFMVRFTEYVNQ